MKKGSLWSAFSFTGLFLRIWSPQLPFHSGPEGIYRLINWPGQCSLLNYLQGTHLLLKSSISSLSVPHPSRTSTVPSSDSDSDLDSDKQAFEG